MYKVSEALPLSEFAGQECEQICLGAFQIQFRFPSGSSISVEGKWELWHQEQILIDEFILHSQRTQYCVHKIIGQKVCGFSINAPTSFTLSFENELALKIYDDLESYESFSLDSSSACSTYV
jgi:hypothetical protein